MKATLTAAAALALVAVGCGSSPGRPDTTVSLRGIERSHRAVHARLDVKERRLRPELARRRTSGGTTPAAPAPAAGPPRPPIVPRLIPFPATRKREMAAYALRHYGIDDYRLRHPKVIVEHYTATADAASAIATFSANVPDSELHELPSTCAHFVIDRDGTIYQLVPLGLMCRHTVGLNAIAIGIEHAGFSDRQILSNARQLASSLALTRWLRCRYGIAIDDVIGHHESLTSPYHHELVSRLRTQTHGDWTRADMDVYRGRLRAVGCG